MDPTSSSFAKITKPKLLKVSRRKRLFSRLDQCRRHPATWIEGPAGSGKTTLVVSYIDDRKLPWIWYQVDAGDSDIATFFYYMGLAGKKTAPQWEKDLPLLTPEYALGIPIFTRRYFEALFDRLKKTSVLVLDNYQEAHEGTALHEVMRDALTVIPEGINLFILSRQSPPKVFARSLANDKMALMGWNDLRFNMEEARELIRISHHHAI